MFSLVQGERYRNDIDGLRAVAVVAVILFHFGWLDNGFLGVDVFFVISGFLITGIIHEQIKLDQFSIIGFYLRRTRRIIPLALFVCLVALVVGIVTMLPDDLENLAESVVATNFFSNNLLQAITTKNYWDVVNEYKPLMHTWSLGVEEQYYLVYPFLIAAVARKRPGWLLPVITALAVFSLGLYLLPQFQHYQKFYLIPFRFWELAAGGILAIPLKKRLISHRYSLFLLVLLIVLLSVDLTFFPASVELLAVVFVTAGLLATSENKSSVTSIFLEHPWVVFLGKISFSLYMWHQVLLSYARYFWVQELNAWHLAVISVLTLGLSILSYYLIEQPFRNKQRVSTRNLLLIVGSFLFLTTAGSLYIYLKGGVLRDVPELGIRKSQALRNIHAAYNARGYEFNRSFTDSPKTKVLVFGDSFSRDWVNVLLESEFADQLEISYTDDPVGNPDFAKRVQTADVIFFGSTNPEIEEIRKLKIPEAKLWAIGTKNFGTSNGIFFNRKGEGYFKQRTQLQKGYWKLNEKCRLEWGERYVDLLAALIDQDRTVPVFTPSNQFISQDCRHLTHAGAVYFADLFADKIRSILEGGR